MIYFIQPVGGGKIKIGTTIRLSTRLKALAKKCGAELRVLAVVKGSYDVERSLHRKFSHLKPVNEWFEPGDDLLGFIVEDGEQWDGRDEASPLVSVKIDRKAARKAKTAAAFLDMTLTDYLSKVVLEGSEQVLARFGIDD